MFIIPTLYIYSSKDVRIHIYFSNTKGFREGESLRNTAISGLSVLSVRVQTADGDSACGHRRWGKINEIF
jgi:hypothetical protein